VKTTVIQPEGATEPATVKMRTTPTKAILQASTGHGDRIDQALAQLKPLTWVGIALCIGGLGLLIFKAKFPLIPAAAGIYAIALGGAFFIIPVFLDRYSWMLLVICGVGLVGAVLYYGSKLNWFHRETGPAVQARLVAKGQKQAAGALEYLRNGPAAAKNVSA
jgi:hypothetical protein